MGKVDSRRIGLDEFTSEVPFSSPLTELSLNSPSLEHACVVSVMPPSWDPSCACTAVWPLSPFSPLLVYSRGVDAAANI